MRPSRILVAVAAALAASAYAADDQPQTQSANEGSAHAQPGHAQAQPPELIRQVQQRLSRSGIAVGTVDGRWSPATQEGVRAFQKQRGMVPTGQLDRHTLAALGLEEPSSSAGSSGPGKLFE